MAKTAGKEGNGALQVKPPRDAEMGDNSDGAAPEISAAEKKEAIYRQRKQSVVEIMAEKAEAQALVKAIGKRLSAARQSFKKDTEIALADLDHILAVIQLQRPERSQAIRDINWMAEMEGLSPGGQMSLFSAMEEANAKTPEHVRSELDWERDGMVSYNKNLECKPPLDCPPEHHQAWMKGWQTEQERRAWAMAAVKVVDRDSDKSNAVSRPPIEDVEDDADDPATACATCGGDGSLLPDEVETCPTCLMVYEPA